MYRIGEEAGGRSLSGRESDHPPVSILGRRSQSGRAPRLRCANRFASRSPPGLSSWAGWLAGCGLSSTPSFPGLWQHEYFGPYTRTNRTRGRAARRENTRT